MEKIKSFEKNKDISGKMNLLNFQIKFKKMTDRLIEKIDLLFSEKEKDILRV